MIGTQLSDNCYQWDFDLKKCLCHLFKSDESKLWHKRLEHISISAICKAIGVEAVL